MGNRIRSIGNFLQSPLLLLVRLYWGYQFAITGFGKLLHLTKVIGYFQSLGLPFPSFTAVLIASIELVCGILLFIGLFSRIAAVFLLCIMAGAYLTAERGALISLVKNMDPTVLLNSLPFLFAYAALLVFCFGPGKVSIDHWAHRCHTGRI